MGLSDWRFPHCLPGVTRRTANGNRQMHAHAADILFFSLAVISGLVTLALKPWSKQWWTSIMLAVCLAVLSGADLYFGNVFSGIGNAVWSYQGSPDSTPLVLPVPTPAPIVTPPASPKPWVSPDEIAAQQKLGHVLLKFSPDQLIGMEANEQNIQIFVNKWVKVDYPIAAPAIPYADPKQKRTYDIVEITEVPTRAILVKPGIIAYFDPKKWGDKLTAFQKGDNLKAYCRFRSIERGKPFNIYGTRQDVMLVDECELP